jgi:hypothetical protein
VRDRGRGVSAVSAVSGDYWIGRRAWAQDQRRAIRSILDALHTPEDQAVAVIQKLQGDVLKSSLAKSRS